MLLSPKVEVNLHSVSYEQIWLLIIFAVIYAIGKFSSQ